MKCGTRAPWPARRLGGRRARLAAWGAAAAICGTLALAAVAYRPEPDLDVLFAAAEFQARLGLLEEARKGLEEVLRRDPGHAYAHLLMGYVCAAEGRPRRALEHYEKGLPMLERAGDESLLADYRVTTAALRLETGDFDGAWRDASAALPATRRPAAALLIRAFSRLGAADDRGYEREAMRAYAADPFDPMFRMRREPLAGVIPWASAFSVGAGCGPRPLE